MENKQKVAIMSESSQFIKSISIVFVILFTNSCQKAMQYESYYLPENLSTKPLAYLYSGTLNNKSIKRYVYQELHKDTLISYFFDSNLQINQIISERIIYNGSKIVDYKLFQNDKIIAVDILSDDQFSFNSLSDKQFIQTRLQWTDPIDSSFNRIHKARSNYRDTNIINQDKAYQAIVVPFVEYINNNKQGSLEYHTKGHEVYAVGLGFTEQVKHINQEFRLQYCLDSVIDGSSFLKKYNLQLP